jgi:hypothetical protein
MRTRRYGFRVDGRLSEESRTAFVDMRITGRRQTIIDGEVLGESHPARPHRPAPALGITVVSAHPVASETDAGLSARYC